MRIVVATLRGVAAIAGLTAITATFFDTASRATINPFNFFGFFTMQSNIILMLVLFVTAALGFARRLQPTIVVLARACATTYIVIVGAVYNTLLVGLEGGVTLEWANWVLHVALPLYAALDWIVFGDRPPLSWKWLWVPLVYPIVWIAVVLLRGATDGWVPYPFLDPALGYGTVAAYCTGIALATAAVASLVWLVGRALIVSVPGRSAAEPTRAGSTTAGPAFPLGE